MMPKRPTARTGSVIALGAWLKNAACRLDSVDGRHQAHWSALHGDLQDPRACTALEASVLALRAHCPAGLHALAHDLHPDFYSTRLAQRLAQEWQVPAIGVQHHHAHIAAVMAEHGLHEPVIGLALDGVGLGTDGRAWGGELLWVAPGAWHRLGHLWPLALPGADKAAQAPWRMLASALHAMGRGAELAARLQDLIEPPHIALAQQMLKQGLNCPASTSAGRWFDAAAAALGLQLASQQEAEAARALEHQASLCARPDLLAPLPRPEALIIPPNSADGLSVLDLRSLLNPLLERPLDASAQQAAALWFHQALAQALAQWAWQAAQQRQVHSVCLGGGCFMNHLLTPLLVARLNQFGLKVYQAHTVSCGDAGLAWGQAWVAAQEGATNFSSTSAIASSSAALSAPSSSLSLPVSLMESLPCA